jgi:hypothetical protein
MGADLSLRKYGHRKRSEITHMFVKSKSSFHQRYILWCPGTCWKIYLRGQRVGKFRAGGKTPLTAGVVWVRREKSLPRRESKSDPAVIQPDWTVPIYSEHDIGNFCFCSHRLFPSYLIRMLPNTYLYVSGLSSRKQELNFRAVCVYFIWHRLFAYRLDTDNVLKSGHESESILMASSSSRSQQISRLYATWKHKHFFPFWTEIQSRAK